MQRVEVKGEVPNKRATFLLRLFPGGPFPIDTAKRTAPGAASPVSGKAFDGPQACFNSPLPFNAAMQDDWQADR